MPGPYCCTVDAGTERDRFLRSDTPCLPTRRAAEDVGDGNGKRPWQSWLQEWEERQRLQFAEHREMTKQLIEALRQDLLERQSSAEKQREKFRTHLNGFTGGRSHCPHKDVRDSKEESPLLAIPSSVRSNKTDSLRGEPKHAAVTFSGLNDSMLAACGFTKFSSNTKSHTSNFSSSLTREESQKTVVVASGNVAAFASSDDPNIHESFSEATFMPSGTVRKSLYKAVHHTVFSSFSGLMIILYSVAVGVISDMEMRSAVTNSEPPDWRWYVDASFTGIFCIEIILRLLAEGRYFFASKEWGWNIFDMTVAAVGVLDVLAVFDLNLGFLRIMRTLRAVRVLRVIRMVRFFKELRLMIASILCCVGSLAWAFILLVSVMYIFAVLLLQGASDYLQNNPLDTENLRDPLAADFGSLQRAVYSLTQAVSGGRSWGEFAEPFLQISPWYGLAFTFFIVFVIFGVLNILTGIFVESTSSIASFDKELVIQEEMARTESVTSQIRQLFKEIDVDNSGTLSYSELKKNLKDERVRAYFSVLQMDVTEAQGLFQLLDRDGSGEVSIDEFIVTCLRLKGSAKSIDLASMLFESKRFHTYVKNFMSAIMESVLELNTSLKAIHDTALRDLRDANIMAAAALC